MTVSVRFSQSTLGEPVSLAQSLGSITPGASANVYDVYISHTGTSPITDCGIYIIPYTAGIYLGTRTAQDDFDDILVWGDVSYPALTGGLYVNQNAAGGFDVADWETFRTGHGDSLANAFPLSVNAINLGAAVAGEIASGGEAHIRIRLDVPAGCTDTGTFYFDVKLDYTATS
jgi:hypothetical protein